MSSTNREVYESFHHKLIESEDIQAYVMLMMDPLPDGDKVFDVEILKITKEEGRSSLSIPCESFLVVGFVKENYQGLDFEGVN